jgi:hypothetical protein
MSFPDYLQNILRTLSIYNKPDYLDELMNLDDRKYLSNNLQNCLMEIDKQHLVEIIKWKEHIQIYKSSKEQLSIYMKDNLQPLIDAYNLEQKKVYDEVFIENAKVQIEEQKNEIASLKEEIGDMKKIIETLLTTLDLKDNPHMNKEGIVPKYQCC